MSVLPVLKLGTLVLRTISKPIANRFKHGAGLHPKFRSFIISVAQANHRFSTKLRRQIKTPQLFDRPIPRLDEERAVQAAADILGELFVFTVAGLAIVYEVQRNSRAEARKEEKRKQEVEAIKGMHQELSKEVETLKGKLAEVETLKGAEVETLKGKLAELEVITKGCSFRNMFKFWEASAAAAEKSANSVK